MQQRNEHQQQSPRGHNSQQQKVTIHKQTRETLGRLQKYGTKMNNNIDTTSLEKEDRKYGEND